MRGLLTLSRSPSCAGNQVVSCQWNGQDTLQETCIVLYKLFPPNSRRKNWTSFESEGRGGSHLLRDKWLQTVRKYPAKKQMNKYCERNAGGYQSFYSTQLSGKFLAAGALTSKEGPVPHYIILHCMAGLRHVYLRATSTNLIKPTNTQARYVCSPERHLT